VNKVKVLVNDRENKGKRIVLEADLIQERATTILVKLPDGNVVKRNKKRDLVI
jgi:hypothetical protein